MFSGLAAGYGATWYSPAARSGSLPVTSTVSSAAGAGGTLVVTTPWGHLPPTHPPLHWQPPTVLGLQLGAGLGRHQAGHEAMVGGWCGHAGTRGDSGTGATRSRTG